MNWQNIPRDNPVVKRAIVPALGALSSFDYSQVEPRLFAYYSATALRDPTIADWYREGRDVYCEIAGRALQKPASEVTKEERQNGKVWFLMSLYSAGPKKIAEELEITYAEAKKFYIAFHEGLPQIKGLSSPKPAPGSRAENFWVAGSIERRLAQRGYIKTPWGRHLHPEQWGEHKMLNKLIQGSAADLLKASLIRIDNWLEANPDIQSRMVLQVHDDVKFDGPEWEVPMLHIKVPQLMAAESWLTDVVPIVVEHKVSTTNWADEIEYEEWKESVGNGNSAAHA